MRENIDPSLGGKWEIHDSQFRHLPVHTALLHTGKILGFGGTANDNCIEGKPYRAELWDIASGSLKWVDQGLDGDLFCCGHSQLADGRILTAGGTSKYDGKNHLLGINSLPTYPFFSGPKDSYLFDPHSERWERIDDMEAGRWYPSLVTLGDGRVFCAAGLTEKFPWVVLNKLELYEPGKGWHVLKNTHRFLPLYPRLHLLPSGEILYSNAYNTHYTFPFTLCAFPTAILNPELNRWQVIGTPKTRQREEGASIMLPLRPPNYHAKILLVGGGTTGGADVTNEAEILDLEDRAAGWQQVTDIVHARYYTYSVILPDGKILILGGRRKRSVHGQGSMPGCGENRLPEHDPNSVMEPELYDPVEDSWTPMANMQIDRQYHASAHLLPDGRVATFGSNPMRRVEELRIEIFSPPYLFQGPRPEILNAPDSTSYGENFTIESLQANEIDEVCVIRFGASTHCTNSDQRLVGLEFFPESESSNFINTSLPNNRNLLPLGYYMLFILKNGVPSVANIMKVGS